MFKAVPFTAEKGEVIQDVPGSDARSRQTCACDQVSRAKHFVSTALELFREEAPH